MGAKLYNIARVTTATTGTGTVTLGSAASGYIDFATAGVANGDVVTYVLEEGANREIGRGTYTSSGTTLSRDTVLKSTNGGSKISLLGAAQVFITAAAEDIGPVIDKQTFNASGTWTKPVGNFTTALIECWGGGGSGARRNTTGSAGGGGGGSYNFREVAFSSLGATETVTIGAGGVAISASDANGNDGGTTTFGTWLSAYGGGGGSNAAAGVAANGGGGGGIFSSAALSVAGSVEGAVANGTLTVAQGRHGGAPGGAVSAGNVGQNGGNALMGGAGGGSTNSGGTPANNSGGTSVGGGNGGAASSTGAATAGTQPAGGGGAARNGQTSGKGGDGRVVITCY